jgi:hypothetical protein
MVVNAILGKLQALRANQIEQPGQEIAQPAGSWVLELAELSLVVRDHSLQDSH